MDWPFASALDPSPFPGWLSLVVLSNWEDHPSTNCRRNFYHTSSSIAILKLRSQSRKLPRCWLHLTGTTTGCRRRWRSDQNPAPCYSTHGKRWSWFLLCFSGIYRLWFSGSLPQRRLLLEEEEGWKDNPGGPHEVEGPGNGGGWPMTNQPNNQQVNHPPPSKHFL